MLTGGDGEVAFHGEYREIVPEERIVTTEVLEMPGAPADDAGAPLNIVTFTERDERTTLTLLVQCESRELRDTILASGMGSWRSRCAERGVHRGTEATRFGCVPGRTAAGSPAVA
ncbi:Uncharacterised protein [Mycobacteroides abscessus subsp. abscessus]|nr:Uncharacterised protein [Mycobacteroides abscessus subsp. abscessus]